MADSVISNPRHTNVKTPSNPQPCRVFRRPLSGRANNRPNGQGLTRPRPTDPLQSGASDMRLQSRLPPSMMSPG